MRFQTGVSPGIYLKMYCLLKVDVAADLNVKKVCKIPFSVAETTIGIFSLSVNSPETRKVL